MKSPIATLALFGSLAAGSALAPAQTQGQAPASGGAPPTSPVTSTGKAETTAPTVAGRPALDPKLFPSATSLPDPTPAEELGKPTVALPNEPIEPWLLTKEHGPFMVLAKTFRGPESEKMALALAKELKFKYNLPAYILRSKDFPGKSNIRGVPPTADPLVTQANISSPEKYRTYDEAAVLVGNLKTEKDAVVLLHQVKKIRPDCLNNMPHMFKWREGLSTALRTTNPYVAAQYLYPHKHDQLIVQMNKGSHSIAHCPGRYTLQVAEFTGRSTFKEKDEQFLNLDFLKKSPLATAADDAERLAEKLAKDPDIRRLGQPIYVFHDRRASRVYVGSFNAPMDPAAVKVREDLVKLAVPLMDAKRPTGHIDQMIVPAGMLTDLKDIKANFQG